VVRQLDAWLATSQTTEGMTPEPLLGTWDQLNADRPPTAVLTATHNAACVLAATRQFAGAERLFRIRLSRGGTLTPFAEALYLLTCWENRHDMVEISDLLRASKGLSREKLQQFVPDLTPVIEDIGSDTR
jgi:hypothetical protein